MREKPSGWDSVFALNSVDVVSAAIYIGVLLAHIPGAGGVDALWRSTLSVGLVLLLLVLDRAESLRYPQGTPSRVAVSLLVARIAVMLVVVQLQASTLAWFLLLIPPFRACLYFGHRASYLLAGVTWLGFFVAHQLNGNEGQPDAPQDAILFAMALVFVCTIARALREERESRARGEGLLARLERSHAQLQAQAETVAELATTEERNRLARDIHDSLGHYLTVTNVQIAKAIAYQYRDPQVAEQAMQHAKDTAHEALDAVRQSVGALRTTRDSFDFAAAMRALVERTRTDELSIDLKTDGTASRFNNETMKTLYYVTQEGLTNVHRHAHASEVAVRVSFAESEARLMIADNGRGFVHNPGGVVDRDSGRGYGLQSMRERLRRIGGRLTVASNPGGGTTLTVHVPRTPVNVSMDSSLTSDEAVRS